jgi:nitrate/TMAO reductase-like tetraheme cytochrome c subunit
MNHKDRGYSAIHMWLRFHYDKTGECSQCHKTKPTEWALRKGKEHTCNIEHYLELCISCHRLYDYTDEQKAKLRAKRLGKPFKPNWKAVRATKSGSTLSFPSVTKASEYFNTDKDYISAALRGRQKTAAGYEWQFIGSILNV